MRNRFRQVAFNSLSRDHDQYRFQGRRGREGAFQLPLSGSHVCFLCYFLCDGCHELSTPSLGITYEDFVKWYKISVATFNSLSRDHGCGTRARTASATFRSAFNSLSRDHILRSHGILSECKGSFNSLSRDHRARVRDFPALRGFLPRRPFAQMISKATI